MLMVVASCLCSVLRVFPLMWFVCYCHSCSRRSDDGGGGDVDVVAAAVDDDDDDDDEDDEDDVENGGIDDAANDDDDDDDDDDDFEAFSGCDSTTAHHDCDKSRQSFAIQGLRAAFRAVLRQSPVLRSRFARAMPPAKHIYP